jgi:hypothetical protein
MSGGAESFIITGAPSWGLALVDPQNAGKVMAWKQTACARTLRLSPLLSSTVA